MKIVRTVCISIFLVALGFIGPSAEALPSMVGQFEKLILQAQKACPSLECTQNPIRVKPLTPTEFSRLDAPTRAALNRSMQSVADIWPDTILEGGYETDFRLRLDLVEIVLMSGKRVGFRFTFSAAANDEDKIAGRIVERGFLSQDFSTDFRDETALAHFMPGAR
jgi:hypothetical protein